jgi:hypothetical protein
VPGEDPRVEVVAPTGNKADDDAECLPVEGFVGSGCLSTSARHGECASDRDEPDKHTFAPSIEVTSQAH